ncbi:Ethyl tert-butyl ether degradation EthD [Gloeothece citriformis PCC 7424]|uniref:Ethyl tert-butyl ether degradation EthD n=1 Tax=Gloeothece citriformis (strain PCC 7424) TaxID=65393 RepID=B7KBU2_GLOC7|nr:EthD domain-containing protein [Gloeothece citriformis]ACK73070.1 Ethyl tert-butyl ether degradation EthD [Gloeothece citriformis PCC 7424]
MIHQLIFAHPRPGMSEKDFQDYWLNIHAVQYASKIPQIKRYMIDLRIPFGPEPEDPLFSGVAEIWIPPEEQIASLQSPEFINGARADEPNWAAFWRTVALDTDAHIIVEGPPLQKDSSLIKLMILVKRKAGIPLEEFRQQMLETHAAKVKQLPGLQRYYQCHVRDGFYAIGESLLDCVSLLWFDNVEALKQAYESPDYQQEFKPGSNPLFEPKYIHTMVTDEHWVIGPEFRP